MSISSRRRFLTHSGLGLGSLAMHYLASRAEAAGPLAAKKPLLPASAKNVIFLFMHGGPSHLETFDPKPKLAAMDGKPMSHSLAVTEFFPVGAGSCRLVFTEQGAY